MTQTNTKKDEENINWVPVNNEMTYRSLRKPDEFVIGVFIEKTLSRKYEEQENYILETAPGVRLR